MRVLIALVVLAASLSLGGCSHPNQVAYAKPLPYSHWTKTRVKSLPPPVRKFPATTEARVKPQGVSKRQIQADATVKPKPQHVRKSPTPTEVSSAKPQPVRNLPELGKVNSEKPPLPPRKPVQVQSPQQGAGPSEQSSGVGQDAEAKFKAAEIKAKLGGVHTLTKEDIDGLSPEQIKELRGY